MPEALAHQQQIQALRRQIQELEEQLRASKEQRDRERNAALRRQRDAMRDLQEKLEVSLRRVEQDSIQKVQQLSEELAARQRQAEVEVEEACRQYQRRQKEILDEIQAVNLKLREELDELRQAEIVRTETGRAAAEAFCQEADVMVEEVDALPHRFFCPGKLDLFLEHLDSARRWMDQGMYEAAAAAADAALAELQILRIDVKDQQRQWEEIYQSYREIALRIQAQLEHFEEALLQTPCGEYSLCAVERDYWSSNAYSTARTELERYLELVKGVENAVSRETWLSSFNGAKGSQFSRKIKELSRLEERINAVIACISGERYYSDQRWQMANDAAPVLDRMGFSITRSRFRGEPKEEPLDSYDVEATPNGEDTVCLTFLPVRRDGVAVGNLCLISTDMRVLPNPSQTQRLVQDLTAYLRPILPKAVQIRWCQDGSLLPAIESEQKKEPNPRLLAKRLERKYR